MEKLGSGRRSFSLRRPPLHRYTTTFQARRGEVDVFEPYEENLPLEAGFYTFVLDDKGRFRIRRGNSSSHASFVESGPVGGAGHFQINRAGNVSEVFCLSLDYGIVVPDHRHPTVGYVIDSFRDHHALELSPLAVFRFKQGSFGTFFVTVEGEPIAQIGDRLERLAHEGEGTALDAPFTLEERGDFASYVPRSPGRLYPMHLDQLVINLEAGDDAGFEPGPPEPRYAPDGPRMASGKRAFILDSEGWLIVGNGHHLLSGGADVGAAGQILVEPSGVIGQVNLNFSGHYRPPLDAEYARWTYRALAEHPLLTLSPTCIITGRKFDDLDVHSTILKFTAEELLADDPELDEMIEYASL